MLKRQITYEDYDGHSQTETFYFNFTKAELIELEVEYEEGLSNMLEAMVAASDNKALLALFKKLVLMAYGVKSDDGKRFIKSDQLREEFTQTPAYSALFIELASNSDAAADFVTGIMPGDLAEQVSKENLANKTANALGTTAGLASQQPPL